MINSALKKPKQNQTKGNPKNLFPSGFLWTWSRIAILSSTLSVKDAAFCLSECSSTPEFRDYP